MIKVISDISLSTFPGGEVNVNIFNSVTIEAKISSSNHVMQLLLTVNALREVEEGIKLHLLLKYFPYARQDRVCSPGEAFSAKVFADLINSLNFTSVEVWDIHNEGTLGLINNVVHISQRELTIGFFNKSRYGYIVAPDKGAVPKLSWVEKGCLIVAGKERNLATGEIIRTVIESGEEKVQGADLLIIDDICDGGRTFIELAKVLYSKGAANVDLYVTHGIFSKGTECLAEEGIHKIYCANKVYGATNLSLLNVTKI